MTLCYHSKSSYFHFSHLFLLSVPTEREKEPRFYKNITRQKMAYAGHVLRSSSGLNALLIMEGKISGVKARGRPRRAWTDDLKDLTELRNYNELKRTAEDRTIWNALARQPST